MNCIKQLYLFRSINVNSIVFTTNADVIQFCNALNVTSLKVSEVNKYGIPTLKGLVEDARKMYKSSYVMYINSDILVNPDIFYLISHFEKIYGQNVDFYNKNDE